MKCFLVCSLLFPMVLKLDHNAYEKMRLIPEKYAAPEELTRCARN